MTTRKFVRNSLVLITVEGLSKVLGLVFFAVLARFLGAADLGRYAFALALANLMILPAKFGFETLVQREVGREPAATRQFFGEIGLLKGVISLAALGLFILILKFTGQAELLIFALAGAFALGFSFMEFVNAFFRANHRPELELTVRSLFSLLNLGLGLAVLYNGGRLAGVFGAQLASVAAAVLLGAALLLRLAPRASWSLELPALLMRLKAAAPFAGILIALFLSNQVGVLLLQPLAGQSAVGYFAAAGRLFDSLTLIPAAIMGAFLPMMSQLYVTSTGDFVRSLRFTLKYLFIFSAPLLVLTVVAAQPILVFLYREAFLPSAPVLQLLGLALLFNFWNYANENALIARNQEKLVLYLTWGTAGLHVAANLMFIYWYSYVGAGWAVLATQAIYCLILFFILVRRYMSLGQLLRLVARPLAGALAMAGCLYFMRHWSILLSGPLSLMVYGGLLLALGAMPRQELDFFLSRKRAGLKQ